MAISKEKFLRAFLDELRENLLSAENQVILLKNDPGNVDALSELLRMLHTIKGSTRMLQFKEMESLVHGAETVCKGVRDGRYSIDARIARFFFLVADRLRSAADSVEGGGEGSIADLELLLEACERLGANEAFDLSLVSMDSSSAPEPAPPDPSGEARASPSAAPEAQSKSREGAIEPEPRSAQLEASIRVDSGTIDRSINLVNTLTIRQLRMRSTSGILESLEKRLTLAYRSSGDLKSLRKELAQVTRSVRGYRSQIAEQVFEIEQGTQELRDSVMGMRMLPLSTILERFPRMVEETASSLGKEVGISIGGDSVRVDRTVLAKLSDPLIHLVRNAIDHGIEGAEDRARVGKPARGTVRIECRTEGSRISVTVSDDGSGLDYSAIRAKALRVWPEDSQAIEHMGNEDLVRLLFRPGFTTKSTATALSGRGVGLDIVKTNIESARGQVLLESIPGSGCVFTLLVPVSASTMDGMFVLCSGRKYFVPASSIARTMLADTEDLFLVREKEMLTVDSANITVTDLSVGIQTERVERRSRKLPLLLVRGPAETVGIVVDRILGYDSLVYQGLPTGLRGNRMLLGLVFDDSFNIVPILNMGAVLDALRSVRSMDTHRRFSTSNLQRKASILVADDSTSTREILVSMLELEGYDVTGAVDGVDALKRLQGGKFNLIVSDLNMPRMDGLKLLENVRADPEHHELPVIIVTTVDEPETRKRAKALGASRYILKSSFAQDDLIAAVKELVDREGATREESVHAGESP
jgi:chemotaxis protein histidine kinase CheA/ActR/RegA family two-component response regulator